MQRFRVLRRTIALTDTFCLICFRLLSFSRSVHRRNQTFGTHVSPISVYVFEACGASVGFENDRPTVRDFDKAWPQGMLALFVDQYMVDTVLVFEWIRHVSLQASVRHSRQTAHRRPAAS